MRDAELRGARTRPILVHLGDRAQHHDGIEALPLREFLAELPA